jgi:hypothetical protein
LLQWNSSLELNHPFHVLDQLARTHLEGNVDAVERLKKDSEWCDLPG